jgi:regulator of protease activity HflC (stomatin/prohibitin superfamily)
MEWVLLALGVLGLSGFRIMREYERAVVFRLGRARKELAGPGVVWLLPLGMDRAKMVDIRIKAIPIDPQEIITSDNISIKVDAVVYADVKSPKDAVLRVEEYMNATMQLASTTLRGVLGRMDLDEILANRDKINEEIRNILDLRTEQWGVEISAVEIKDIALPQEMKRAMARQAEAERERRAKVIAALGEEQAAQTLANAAQLMAAHPGAMQLRLYQTLVEVSVNQNTTVVLPVPVELLAQDKGGAAASYMASAMATSVPAMLTAQQKQAHAQLNAPREQPLGLGQSALEEAAAPAQSPVMAALNALAENAARRNESK